MIIVLKLERNLEIVNVLCTLCMSPSGLGKNQTTQHKALGITVGIKISHSGHFVVIVHLGFFACFCFIRGEREGVYTKNLEKLLCWM